MLDPRAINLAHALDDFLHTRHIFTHEFHQHTVILLTYTTTFYITPKGYLDPSVSLDWALDRLSEQFRQEISYPNPSSTH